MADFQGPDSTQISTNRTFANLFYIQLHEMNFIGLYEAYSSLQHQTTIPAG